MASNIGRGVVSLVVTTLLCITAWTTYTNVFADDSALRGRAEKLARETIGCARGCTLSRVEGSRGIFKETLVFSFQQGVVTVTCKRPYVAVGEHRCEATK